MTWDQIELFADAAAERVKRDMLQNANLSALGTAVGFSGERKPLRDLARAMDLPVEPAPSTGPERPMADIQKAVGDLASSGHVRIKSHGSNSRRAVDRAGRPNRRVPRGTPKG